VAPSLFNSQQAGKAFPVPLIFDLSLFWGNAKGTGAISLDMPLASGVRRSALSYVRDRDGWCLVWGDEQDGLGTGEDRTIRGFKQLRQVEERRDAANAGHSSPRFWRKRWSN
jgi:hypothetical protein